MIESKAIAAVADNLKAHPVAFAIIVINALFLAAAVWVLSDVAANERARTEAVNVLLKQCVDKIQERRDAR
jgi:hypothetical protein